jgi:hypothetical protein
VRKGDVKISTKKLAIPGAQESDNASGQQRVTHPRVRESRDPVVIIRKRFNEK